ncbi:MAG: hypothetical protein LBK99_26030, partial [Opitutaceae bacterium]|nr:hypothetical protein [Opitutaceae bacterium]
AIGWGPAPAAPNSPPPPRPRNVPGGPWRTRANGQYRPLSRHPPPLYIISIENVEEPKRPR